MGKILYGIRAMRSGFRKFGLILSMAAVLLIVLCLPFHYHAGDGGTRDSSHCAVCHFSKEGKASGFAEPSPCLPGDTAETIVPVPQKDPLLLPWIGLVTQRAPPAALA